MELHPTEYQILASETGYTQDQLRKIKRRFDLMDTNGKGYISIADLNAAIPGLKDMPLSGRVCKSITEASPSSGDQTQIDFKLMVNTMAIYRDKSKNEQS